MGAAYERTYTIWLVCLSPRYSCLISLSFTKSMYRAKTLSKQRHRQTIMNGRFTSSRTQAGLKNPSFQQQLLSNKGNDSSTYKRIPPSSEFKNFVSNLPKHDRSKFVLYSMRSSFLISFIFFIFFDVNI